MDFRALIAFLLVSSSISGCLGVTEEREEDTGVLPILEDPCMTPSDAVTQSLTSIEVNGVEREFRLSVPSSVQGTSLPLVIAFHGGTDSQEDFAQQEQFDQLGEQEKFIMAYAIAEQDRTAAEGEWFLNTAATSKEDNNFTEAIVEELSGSYCLDQDRLYAIGYSLGAMFTYEVACQLNHRFAATASFAGTMPVSPESCDIASGIGILHIHGKLDYIIYYHQDWDWKDGEHEGVGTMSEVPNLIDYWAEKSSCQANAVETSLTEEHVIHSDCIDGVIIEHYGLQIWDHNWPGEVGGEPTYELMWNFLSQFSKDSPTVS
jgi:polyhydroxybutyrate depolymerase|tara:strand:+ start:429 stop:1382 length:954 start_codon:yes stop_codon:yes gene_type:complete